MDHDVFVPRAREAFSGGAEQRRSADADQDASDFDQTIADYDQTFSDGDQSASERDADHNQQAADRDQQAADRDQADADPSLRDSQRSRWANTRRSRSQSSIGRDISVRARRESALARDAVAQQRDLDADTRDGRARRRDELAAALDAEMEALERADTATGSGSPPQLALRARQRAALARESSARARASAADDRAAAHADRVRAAEDRGATAQRELLMERLDQLNGAQRHSSGLGGLRRELDRTRRVHESLTVAFFDVDDLDAVNQERGDREGDALLQEVVARVKGALRDDYFIARLGGDEFVCVLYGWDPNSLGGRFAQIAAEVAERHGGATIIIGPADARSEDCPEQLFPRAEHAMHTARREHAKANERQSEAETG